MAKLSKIRDIARAKRIPLNELSDKVGLSQAGLYRIISTNTTKVETLEKIAKELDVSVMVFFDEGSGIQVKGSNIALVNNGHQSVGGNKEIDILRRELEDSKKEVQLLRKIIALLEKGK